MEILPIIGYILLITLLGLLVAFSPMLIVMDVVIVLKSRRPLLNSILLIAGVLVAMSFVFGIASQIVSPETEISLANIQSKFDTPPFLDIFAGALLLIFGLKTYFSKKKAPFVVERKDIKIPEKPYAVFFVSFIKSLLSVTNIFAALIIARLIVSNKWGMVSESLAFLWVLIVGLGPFIFIGYLKIFKKQSLNTIDVKINQLLSRDTRFVLPIILTVIGACFLGYGLMTVGRG